MGNVIESAVKSLAGFQTEPFLGLCRRKPVSTDELGEWQADRLIKLFTEAHHGREPTSADELAEWFYQEDRSGRRLAGP
jgi:hypothetical protein